jgi:hypothetical protein
VSSSEFALRLQLSRSSVPTWNRATACKNLARLHYLAAPGRLARRSRPRLIRLFLWQRSLAWTATVVCLRPFLDLKDPRRHNVRHRFTDLLTIAILAVLCKSDDWTQVVEWAGAHRLWLKTFLTLPNPENLTVQQREQLEALQRKFPALAKLSRHREKLREIFQDKRVKRPDTAVVRLRAWCERGRRMGLKALEPFYRTPWWPLTVAWRAA